MFAPSGAIVSALPPRRHNTWLCAELHQTFDRAAGKLSAKSAFVTIGQQKTGPPKRTGSAKPSFNPSKRRLALPPESLNGEQFAENSRASCQSPRSCASLDSALGPRVGILRCRPATAPPSYAFLSAKLWSIGPFSPFPMCIREAEHKAFQTKSFAISTASRIGWRRAIPTAIAAESVQPVP